MGNDTEKRQRPPNHEVPSFVESLDKAGNVEGHTPIHGSLYVDPKDGPKNGRLGFRTKDGGSVQVPLEDVLKLLRGSVL